MVAFLALTSAEDWLPKSGEHPSPTWYPIAYAAKIAIVGVLMWLGRSAWRDLSPRPGWRVFMLAAALGLAVIVVWIGIERFPYPKLMGGGKRQAFDPWVLSPLARYGFLAVRIVGMVVLVPVMEELFWRSFLIRLVIDADFTKVPIGKVTPVAGGVSAALFAAAHPEWIPALLTGLAWAWLLWYTKSLMACVFSHSVANLALAAYVLATGDWRFW
jgi:CAAX prenyl protease-like protein